MKVSDLPQVRELKIVDAAAKLPGNELPDKGIDDAKTFTRAGCPDQHGAAERVDQIDPAVPDLPLEVELHGDIDGIRCDHGLDRLHKAFAFDVPFILAQS